MDNSAKKKAAVSAVAAVTAASVLVGGAFTSPADILDDSLDGHVLTVDMDMDAQTDAGDDGGSDSGEEEKGGSRLTASVRRLVRQAPAPVRACVALPLWLLGTLLINMAATLWGAVFSPVASALLGWVAVAVMVMLVFLLAAKTIAPDLPIKKILNKRSVSGILLLCLCFGALDCVLPLFVEGYDKFSQVARAAFSCICTAVPIGFFIRYNSRRLHKKAKEQQEREAELSYEQRQREARLLIEELADSVSRPRY